MVKLAFLCCPCRSSRRHVAGMPSLRRRAATDFVHRNSRRFRIIRVNLSSLIRQCFMKAKLEKTALCAGHPLNRTGRASLRLPLRIGVLEAHAFIEWRTQGLILRRMSNTRHCATLHIGQGWAAWQISVSEALSRFHLPWMLAGAGGRSSFLSGVLARDFICTSLRRRALARASEASAHLPRKIVMVIQSRDMRCRAGANTGVGTMARYLPTYRLCIPTYPINTYPQ